MAGPLSWFVQLTVGYALLTGTCYASDQRLSAPGIHLSWTRAAAGLLMMICVVVALVAFYMAWRALPAQHEGAMHVSEHRARFAAIWSAALSAGFCVATLCTAVGLVLLPRCGG